MKESEEYTILKEDIILKKCGWLFYKKRKVVLTSDSKIKYYDPKTNVHRGDIILNKNVKAEKTEDTKFNIITLKKTYCFKGLTAEKTTDWINSINSIIKENI